MKKLLLFVIACTLGLFSTVNAQSRLSSVTYASEGNNITYVYEEGTNKVLEVRHGVHNDEWGWQVVTFLTYNANGQLVSTEYGTNYDATGIDKDSYYAAAWTTTEYTYAADGKLSSYTVKEFENWTLFQEPCTVSTSTLTYEGDNVVEVLTTGKYYGESYNWDANAWVWGWVDYSPSKRIYTYEDGKLVNEESFYYDQYVPGYVSNNDPVTYAYDANGNCISATKTQYGNETVTEYIYDETKLAADVYAFSFPHEVKPISTNIVANTETYSYYEDYETGEPVKGEVTVATYNYTFATVAKPIAPVVAAGAVTETTVELSWAAVDGATSYNVYVGEAAAVSVTETTYTATGLTPATEYTFTVTAVNEGGESAASNVVKVTTEALTPLAPVAAVTKITDTEITLVWESVAKATSYNVYVGEAAAVNVTETTYTATGLTPETEYSFVVTAANEHGESNKPEAVVAKTKAAAVVLPENMVAIGDGDELGSYPFSLDNIGVNETYGYTAYGVSQQLYTAEEIAKEAGYIKSYALKFAGPKTDPSFETAAEQEDVVVEFEIYVQNTELETLQENVTEQASSQVVEAEDLYYAGKTTLVNGDWTTFEFDYPFEYKGGNIIVTIYCLSVENGKTNWYPFYVYNTESTAITSLQICPTERPTTGKAISPINAYYTRNQVLLTFTEEGEVVPERPKEYRLESIESYSVESYVYDETYTNRVISFVGTDGLNNVLTYNEAGQLETVKSISESEEEISSIEYTYNEDGTLASYSETSKHPATGAMITTTTNYTYENGRLAKVENVDWEIEMTYVYNEDGTVKEVVEPYMSTVFTYENGKLVKNASGYEDEETGEFIAESEEVYTYDVNGNCVKQESYQYGSLYQVHQYFYDATIAAEDVYTFALPHMAITNVEPLNNNVLVKELSYYSVYDEEVGEVVTHTYNVKVYHYNPAIEMAPITPMNLVAEVVEGTVKLTWEAFVDAELFIVYQDGEAVAEDVKEGVYTIEGLEEGEYTFAVQAVNAVGRSSVTEEIEVTVGEEPIAPAVPAAPVVEVVEVTESTIVFAWSPVEGAVKYNVYAYGELAGSTPDTIAGFKDLNPNTEYCFTVTAVNAENVESEHSEEVCATTKPEGIAENAAAFNIYPNPVADRLFIETEANVEEVTIYTLTGVMIYSEVDFNNNTINVSELNGGVYIMKVRTENGEAVRRFIKK